MFKEQLFSICPDRKIEPVDTPAGRTYVRSLTVGEKDTLDLAINKEGGHRARFVIACCCKEDGSPEFDEFDLGRIEKLPVYAVESIFEAALKVNKISDEDAEKLRKNSGNGRIASSSSG